MIDGADLELFERSVRQATGRHTGPALDEALAELGWHDALEADPGTAVSVLFPLQGHANVTSAALQHVVGAPLGVGAGRAARLVLPALGTWQPPGRVAEGRLAVRGLATSAVEGAPTALVVAAGDGAAGDGERVLAEVAVGDLHLRAVSGMDPAAGLVEVTGEVPLPGSSPVTGWEAGVAAGQTAVGLELVGAARAMLDLARQHALDRVQFGQPIARFQAVRHRLAETLVAIESADAVLAAARETPSPEMAATAKALSGRGARTAARHCQQVLAGIGFTAEHPFHRYLRRVLVLDQLMGSSRALTEDMGRRLLADRRLPELLPL